MATVFTPDEIAALIESVALGDISLEDAARRLNILETEPEKYYCNTCRFFRNGMCNEPGQPPRPEHPLSVRCHDGYIFDDPRDSALPYEPSRGKSRMFK